MSVINWNAAAPETLGIPTEAILDFLGELSDCQLPIHSVLIIRHNRLAAEGYCPWYDRDRKHRMYSVSKSFTSVAVGMLITEGRLSLTDRVADFFPEYLPDNPSPYALEATVRDLLTMSTNNERNAYHIDHSDFVRSFFDNDIAQHKPGTIFHYDTNGTVVLCAIVEKITGMPCMEYMRPLFKALGMNQDIWCIQSPEGRSWTGSGVLATSRDLAILGQFCMNLGQWEGRQWVSREYMRQAVSPLVDVSVAHSCMAPEGYGYQIWTHKDGGFAFCGMGCQFAFMSPKKNSVVVITADCQHFNNAEDLVRDAYYRMISRFRDGALEENPAALRELARALSLEIPLPAGKKTTPLAEKISGRTYVLDHNLFGFKWMKLDVAEDVCTLHYEKGSGVHSIPLHMGRYGKFLFPDRYAGKKIDVFDTQYRSFAAAAWDKPDTLLGQVFLVDDYLGSFRIQMSFFENTLTVFMTKAAENFLGDYRGYLAGHAVDA